MSPKVKLTEDQTRKVSVLTEEVRRLEQLVAARKRKVTNAEGKLAMARTRLDLAKEGKL